MQVAAPLPDDGESPGNVVICTGFHRSGTSLTAQWLHRTGVSMGEQLLSAHRSNPDGHFEDPRAVALHDAWLQRHDTDWLFDGQSPLAADTSLDEAIVAYVSTRDAATNSKWGVKDPRMALCLPSWDAALGGRGRYLLLARHWSECAQSLVTRHARELAHHLPSPLPHQADLRAWVKPETIYRAWLATNRRLLEFVQSAGDRAWIATARGIAQANSIGPADGPSTAVSLPGEFKPALKAGLLSHRVELARLPPLPAALRIELDDVWAELLAAASVRADDEAVEFSRTHLRPLRRRRLQQAVDARLRLIPKQAPITEGIAGLPDRVRLKLAQGRHRDAAACIDELAAADAGDPRLLEAQAEVALATGAACTAAELFGRIAAETGQARVSFKQVRALLADGRAAQALAVLEQFDDASMALSECWAWRAKCLALVVGDDARDAFLTTLPPDHPTALHLRATATFANDYAAGMALYRQAVRRTLGSKPLSDWLARACASIPTAAAFDALLEALLPQWYDVLGEEETLQRVGLAKPRAYSDEGPTLLMVSADMQQDLQRLANLLAPHGWQSDDGALARLLMESRDPAPPDVTDALSMTLLGLEAIPGPQPQGILLTGAAMMFHADALLRAHPGIRLLHLERHGLEAALDPAPLPADVMSAWLHFPADPGAPAQAARAWCASALALGSLEAIWPKRVIRFRLGSLAARQVDARAKWHQLFPDATPTFITTDRHRHRDAAMFSGEVVALVKALGCHIIEDVERSLPVEFSPAQYLALHQDLKDNGMDPVQHWHLHGRHEGRNYQNK